LSRSRTQEARLVERARIVLACLEGKEIQQVARETGASIPTVSKWRRRFSTDGIRGLEFLHFHIRLFWASRADEPRLFSKNKSVQW
jgi:transposase-like protein